MTTVPTVPPYLEAPQFRFGTYPGKDILLTQPGLKPGSRCRLGNGVKLFLEALPPTSYMEEGSA